jgi:DNA repair photolyase
MSINTLDEDFKNDMDNASSIEDRLNTLKELHSNGIYTILFMSPIFPEITDFKAIIEKSRDYIDEYWFENLNLRGSFKQTILTYIKDKYAYLSDLYENIFVKGYKEYWIGLSIQIDEYCKKNNIKYINYFYHEELVKAKLDRERAKL